MKKKIFNKVKGLAKDFLPIYLFTLIPFFTSCSETWDDHYDSTSSEVMEGSLWQAMQQNPNLSNFTSVLQAVGYDKSLGGSQVFTVFAPTNDCFSKSEADALISEYNEQKARRVRDDDNTVIKEFVQNHIALYNYSVSSVSNDSITLMNGKYAVLKNNTIDGRQMLTSNDLYENGVLFTLGQKLDYVPSVFEYFRLYPDMDSVASFLYNSHYYYKEFEAELSVPGGLENGKTVYLDSVFTQTNELFDYLGKLSSEDSTYYMVAPTNELWTKLVEEYEPYFNYAANVEDRDSLAYTNTRMAIMQGTSFSRTFNSDAVLRDSAMSTSAVMNYAYRKSLWGENFHYYQYNNPTKPGGVFSSPNFTNCSNGRVYTVSEWPISKLETFGRYRIIEAEGRTSLKEVSTYVEKGEERPSIEPKNLSVSSDSKFYNKVWNNSFIKYETKLNTMDHIVTYNVENVLSNFGYDIYLVTAPVLANDSNATEAMRLPTILTCTMLYNNQEGKQQQTQLVKQVETKPDEVDYILLAEDFKFPVSTYGLDEAECSTLLQVSTDVKTTQIRRGTHQRTMYIDCVLLVPHGTLTVNDDEVLMYPHGETDLTNSYWIKKR